MCAWAVRSGLSVYLLCLRIRPDITPVTVFGVMDIPEKRLPEKEAPVLFLLCEHIASVIILIFLFPVILSRILSIRIASYVHPRMISLNISVMPEDMSAKMLMNI